MEDKSQFLCQVSGVHSAGPAPPGFDHEIPRPQPSEMAKVEQPGKVPEKRSVKNEIPRGNIISCSDLEAVLLKSSLNMNADKNIPGPYPAMTPNQRAPNRFPFLQNQQNIIQPQQLQRQQANVMSPQQQTNMMSPQQQKPNIMSPQQKQTNMMSPEQQQQLMLMLAQQYQQQANIMLNQQKKINAMHSQPQKQSDMTFLLEQYKMMLLQQEQMILSQQQQNQNIILYPQERQQQQQNILFSMNQQMLPQQNMVFPKQQQKMMLPQQQQQQQQPEQNNSVNKKNLNDLPLPFEPQQLQQNMSSPQQQQGIMLSPQERQHQQMDILFSMNQHMMSQQNMMFPQQKQTISLQQQQQQNNSVNKKPLKNLTLPLQPHQLEQGVSSPQQQMHHQFSPRGFSPNISPLGSFPLNRENRAPPPPGFQTPSFLSPINMCQSLQGISYDTVKSPQPWSPARQATKSRSQEDVISLLFNGLSIHPENRNSNETTELLESRTSKEPAKESDNGPKPENESSEYSANKKKKKKKKDKAKKKQSGSKEAKESDELKPGVNCNKKVISSNGKEFIGEEEDAEQYQQERGRSRKSKKKKREESFEPYISPEDVEKGLADKTLFQNDLRINPKNHNESYISDIDNGQDIVILGLLDRNRSLEGDIVVVQLKNEAEWHKSADGTPCRTGKVVFVSERVHHGSAVGSLRVRKKDLYMFVPRDQRFPLLRIPSTAIPQHILSNINTNDNLSDVMYKAVILSWNTPKYANGIIQEVVGKKGEIDCETTAIFMELGLNKNPIPEKYNRHLPSLPYIITQEEIDSRLDLRSEVIFTIDPATARDLDDAVSIKKLDDGMYEVGVHIADVTHFLEEGTPLDIEVSERATTVYMVERAYHMLPLVLCGLCSLLPGEDKLAVSVIMKLDEEGNVLDKNFYRTVINSCAQLTYEHAQALIDDEDVELPTIFNDVSPSTIKEAILSFNKIATIRRKRRFDCGALKIDQPKVGFSLTSDCTPQDMFLHEIKDSHRLIEEFMLLANELVARYIHSKQPDIALLRRHDPPKMEMMTKLENSLQKLGIFLDSSCAGSFHTSLNKYCAGDPLRTSVLYQICTKPLQRAVYFCADPMTHHYALNVDKYTHFTSPIRRYADVVVHRILTACLGYSPLPPWTKHDVRKFATNSNRKKFAAKKAGDMSSNLFRAIYIRNAGGVTADAVIAGVNSRSIDVNVPSMALNLRVYLENLENVSFEYHDNDIGSMLMVEWPGKEETQVLQLFTPVKLHLSVNEKTPTIIEGKLLPPES